MAHQQAIVNFEMPIAASEQITEEQRLRQEFIMGLVMIAKLFNDNPGLDVPRWTQDLNLWPSNGAAGNKQQLAIFAKVAGKVEKVYDDSTFRLEKRFGDRLLVKMWADRDEVCERVVVGSETIPAHVVPAVAEKHVPEQTVEKVEWRCHSILADGPTFALEAEAGLAEVL